MRGTRLLVGFVVMGVGLPVALSFLLHLNRPTQILAVAATCFFSWCVADFGGTVLSRPRLQDRSPTRAIREWEQTQEEEPSQEGEN